MTGARRAKAPVLCAGAREAVNARPCIILTVHALNRSGGAEAQDDAGNVK